MPTVFFVCVSFSTTFEIMHLAANRGFVYRVHPLPSGCEWVDREGAKAVSVYNQQSFQVSGQWFVIANVETENGAKGYSVGYPILN